MANERLGFGSRTHRFPPLPPISETISSPFSSFSNAQSFRGLFVTRTCRFKPDTLDVRDFYNKPTFIDEIKRKPTSKNIRGGNKPLFFTDQAAKASITPPAGTYLPRLDIGRKYTNGPRFVIDSKKESIELSGRELFDENRVRRRAAHLRQFYE